MCLCLVPLPPFVLYAIERGRRLFSCLENSPISLLRLPREPPIGWTPVLGIHLSCCPKPEDAWDTNKTLGASKSRPEEGKEIIEEEYQPPRYIGLPLKWTLGGERNREALRFRTQDLGFRD